jgi:tRNA1(Val) A37 N6-methylase TrmN6
VPAVRVLVRAVKGSLRGVSLLPGLTLNDEAGKPTPQAEAVLRGGETLRLVDR